MTPPSVPLHKRLYLLAAGIIVAGLASATVVYVRAAGAPDTTMVDDFLQSKRYAHELQAYGGKASVVADEFLRWFSGLWQGEALAGTIACLSVVSAVVCVCAGRSLRPAVVRMNGYSDEKSNSVP